MSLWVGLSSHPLEKILPCPRVLALLIDLGPSRQFNDIGRRKYEREKHSIGKLRKGK